MPDSIDQPPLTEPLIIPCVFASGMAVQVDQGVLRMVGWVHLPALGGEMEERRIVARLVMSVHGARNLRAALNKALPLLG